MMRAKVSHTKNKGSEPTRGQIKSGAIASMGSKKSIRTRGGRGSYEGYGYAPRADIESRTQGYMSKDVQRARYRDIRAPEMDRAIDSLSSSGFINPTAISNIGVRYTGSARILRDRMELNGV